MLTPRVHARFYSMTSSDWTGSKIGDPEYVLRLDIFIVLDSCKSTL